jgi:hypothetical protein
MAITIWKNGEYRVWGGMDAFYAQADPDFLVNIALSDIEADAAKERADATARGALTTAESVRATNQ